MSDFSDNPVAANYRTRAEHDRREARHRYHDRLSAVFAQHSVVAELEKVALKEIARGNF